MSVSIDPKAETVRVASLVVKALTDVGQAYRRDDGTWQTIRFRTTGYGEITGGALVAVLEVDTQRLPKRVTARDLVKPEMLHHLSTVCGHPVRCLNSVGVTYVVGLTPPPAAPRLPSRVPLDLDHRPTGDLPVPIGVGRDGSVWVELRDLGHTLVTGTSGSGKSSWIHAALAGLLSGTDRTRIQVALIDPKRSEFAAWAGVPQLYGEIATDDTSSAKLLDMLVGEMERRGDLLAGALARDLASYNKRAAAQVPYMLVVVDEVLDLLLGGNKAIETSLVRLAAKFQYPSQRVDDCSRRPPAGNMRLFTPHARKTRRLPPSTATATHLPVYQFYPYRSDWRKSPAARIAAQFAPRSPRQNRSRRGSVRLKHRCKSA